MKIIFPLFLGMLAMIGLGVWLNTPVLANMVGIASITGLLIFVFRQPDGDASDVPPTAAWLAQVQRLTLEQKKQWYSLFIIGLVFSLIFGSFWNAQMGGA